MSAGGDSRLTAVRDAPLGGQAVLEGVMMRGVRNWAVAVREPVDWSAVGPGTGAASSAVNGNGDGPVADGAVTDGPVADGAVTDGPVADGAEPGLGKIAVHSFTLTSWTKRHRVYRLPVIRGVVALVESLGVGLRAL